MKYRRYLGFLSIIVFRFLFVSTLFAQDLDEHTLLQQIEQSEGEEKLELMYTLIRLRRDAKDNNLMIDEIIKEAQKQNNNKYLINAYQFKMRYHMVNNDLDSMLYCRNQIDALNTDDEYMIGVDVYLYNLYLNRGYHDLAIHNLKAILRNSKKTLMEETIINNLLACAYLICNNYELVKKHALKAIETSRGIDPSCDVNRMLSTYEVLVAALAFTGEYDKALEVCSELDSLIEKGANQSDQIYVSRFLLYYMQEVIYVEMGNEPMAKLYLNKMLELPHDNIPDKVKNTLNLAWCQYYF